MNRSPYPIHCVTFACLPSLTQFSENYGLFLLSDVNRTLVIDLAIALVLFLGFLGLTRERNRGGLMTSASLLFFFNYSFIHQTLSGGSNTLWLNLSLFTLLAILIFAIARFSVNWSLVTQVLNVASFGMLVVPAISIGSYLYWDSSALATMENLGQNPLVIAEGSEKPHVVHIVVDGYPREDLLNEIFGFDNGSFIQGLRTMGFFVADRGTTAYGQTEFSMASTLSGTYLTEYLEYAYREKLSPNQIRSFFQLRFHRAGAFEAFKSAGYEIVIPKKDWRFISFFEDQHYQKTPLYALYLSALGTSREADILRRPLKELINQSYRRPTFSYVHLLAPHPPFLVDRDGNLRDGNYLFADGSHFMPGDPHRERDYRVGFIEKLRFLNKTLMQYLPQIIEKIPDPKIIFLHGDHGSGLYYHHDLIEDTCSRERFSTLLAVYDSERILQRNFSAEENLVNIYRILFRENFGVNLKKLPSVSFYTPWLSPSEFQEISQEELAKTCPKPGA